MKESKGNSRVWKVVKNETTVVSDSGNNIPTDTGHSDTSYYGGYLIAESIYNKEDAQLIAAAPDLLKASMSALRFMLKTGITYDNADIYNELNASINKAIGK